MRLAFLALVFVSLFSGLAVANEEAVAPAAVGIAPTALPALPLLIPITIVGFVNLAAWLGVGYLIVQYVVQPLVSGIAIMFSIWILFKGLALLIGAYSGNRGR